MNETKFVRVFRDDDGSISTWKYDLSISKAGPIETNIDYPKGSTNVTEEISLKKNKTEQKYLNPHNGKYVGYTRARALGLI